MKSSLGAALLLLAAAPSLVPAPSAPPQDEDQAYVSELLRELYEADQAARAGWSVDGQPTPEEIRAMHEGDGKRREDVLAILRDGMLTTGEDHFHAAMILQHGGAPEDYLLSHVLSTVGGFEGHDGARWLSAASLDRFLQSVGRPQVFGTQSRRDGDGPWTKEPIDGALFPDTVRARYGVPPLENEQR